MKRTLSALVLLAALSGVVWSQRERLWPPPKTQPGPAAGGGNLLPSGWMIRPAGRQVPLTTLPLAARLTPDGKRMVILQSGYKKPAISLHDTESGAVLARLELKDSFHGLAVHGTTGGGTRGFAGGGTTGSIVEFEISGDALRQVRTIPYGTTGDTFVGDVTVSADGATLYAADLLANTVALFSTDTGQPLRRFETGRIPYRLLLDPDRKELVVTSWSDGEVIRHDLASGRILQRVAAGAHTTDMIWQGNPRRLFVTASHTNTVAVLNQKSNGELVIAERVNVSLMPKQPVGMTPSALALDANNRLYIACSDANAVAVADVSGARSRVLGFIPAGWYPTGLLFTPGKRLAILNGKGERSFPNPAAPRKDDEQKQSFPHGGTLQTGSLTLLDPFDDARLAEYSRQTVANSPYRDRLLEDAGVPAGNPIPNRPGAASPIKHVIYIVKENRTYDQVFGDMPGGNGDPSLVLFSEAASVNHRKLAREFLLFDNFYVNGDVSADGHNWSAGAIAPDMTNKLWPNLYSGRAAKFSLYWGRPPVNHTEDAARPHGGYLWTGAFKAGLTVRNYGWLTKARPQAKSGEDQIADAESPELLAATSRLFRPYDLTYPDVDRMKFFLDDLAGFERAGKMPRLMVMRLGNDHTSGLSPGAVAPRSMFADNDLALGRLVEAVSKSRFWKDTAIFVLEDDAQNGPDHIDSHRSIAFVISPYARRQAVDSGFYNTVSMLRTMELILGLPPMTHFDAAAQPMYTAFTAKPDLTPYQAEMPRVSLTEKNPARGALAARSLRLDFSEADRIDDAELNDILYRGIQGRPAPAPVRSVFNPSESSGEEEE